MIGRGGGGVGALEALPRFGVPGGEAVVVAPQHLGRQPQAPHGQRRHVPAAPVPPPPVHAELLPTPTPRPTAAPGSHAAGCFLACKTMPHLPRQTKSGGLPLPAARAVNRSRLLSSAASNPPAGFRIVHQRNKAKGSAPDSFVAISAQGGTGGWRRAKPEDRPRRAVGAGTASESAAAPAACALLLLLLLASLPSGMLQRCTAQLCVPRPLRRRGGGRDTEPAALQLHIEGAACRHIHHRHCEQPGTPCLGPPAGEEAARKLHV